jgi:hypothetical protein
VQWGFYFADAGEEASFAFLMAANFLRRWCGLQRFLSLHFSSSVIRWAGQVVISNEWLCSIEQTRVVVEI